MCMYINIHIYVNVYSIIERELSVIRELRINLTLDTALTWVRNAVNGEQEASSLGRRQGVSAKAPMTLSARSDT